jgi:TM2 domain-containing membrane protein YozV
LIKQNFSTFKKVSMKRIITLLVFALFAATNVSFAAAASISNVTTVAPATTISAETKIEKAAPKADLSQKQIIAAVLAFFLGTLGIHNFYLGRRKQGIWQLVLTIVGSLTAIFLVGFVLIAAVWIWSIVDLIKILTGKLG